MTATGREAHIAGVMVREMLLGVLQSMQLYSSPNVSSGSLITNKLANRPQWQLSLRCPNPGQLYGLCIKAKRT